MMLTYVIGGRNTAQKMKFSIKDFFSKCDQIRRKNFSHGKINFLCSEKVGFKLCMLSNLHIATYILISYVAKRSNYSFRSWVVKVYENSSDAQIASRVSFY